MKALQRKVSALKSEIKQLCETSIGAFLPVQQAEADLNNVFTAIKFAIPHVVCPKCNGGRCDTCRKTGWLPKEVFERMPK
jgi:hypothetical protein